MRTHLITAVIALAFGLGGAALWSATGFGDDRTRDYLLENPEILRDMAAELQKQEAQERLADVADDVTTAFPGAVMGNPNGSKTLVEFTDYNCGFCRQSTRDVQAMVAADPELRVVIREWPIFEGSEQAARMALAAAAQGKYEEFHSALFALGPVSESSIARAAETSGLNMDEAARMAASGAVTAELDRNAALARQLGFGGTPSWVAGGQLLEGAVGAETLTEVLNAES